ncbi:MAG: hypothetical protein OXR73_34350, partial [Myxococcales bacterium]|nr:hypothetical protein [Myxococcales bacterium]
LGLATGAGLGVVGGYGLTEELLLTASLAIAHASESFTAAGVPVENSADTLRLDLTPGVEYLLFPGEPLRPFVGGILGLRHRSTPVAASEIDELSLMLGAQVGVHYFVDDLLSFDTRLMVAYLFGLSASSDGAFGPTDYSSANGPAVVLTAGLSYWH